MSLAAVPENNLAFPGGNNVRIAIAGLSICRFGEGSPPQTSSIRFLRHVPNHLLKMKITQKLAATQQITGEASFTLRKELKTITISGAQPVTGFEYKPTSYSEYELRMMIDLQFLHKHPLTPKIVSPPVEAPTQLTISNCLFYTAALTDHKFDLKRNNVQEAVNRQFGEVLGGYMRVVGGDALTINIPGLFPLERISLPTRIDGSDYVYEIQFNNSCFDEKGQPCPSVSTSTATDFLKIYDLLMDSQNPLEIFDLEPLEPVNEQDQVKTLGRLGKKGVDTGACLPVVESPCLTNCS